MKFFTSTIERMRITSGGNVGIGLTNPGEKFVVSGNSARIKIQTASDPSAYYTYLESNYDGSNSFNIVDGGLHKFGSKALVTHNDTYINSYYNVYIATGTTTNSSASNIRLFVNSTGNVGIGTTSPIQKLDTPNIIIGGSTIAGTYRANALFMDNNGGNSRFYSSGPNGTTQGSYEFNIMASDANPLQTILVINSSGKVGIGTTSPSAKLHVMGTTGLPATSGTAFTGTMRLQVAGGYGTVMDFGAVGPSTGTQWIQVTDSSNQAIQYPLLLQPNGGNVGIGTVTPANKLDVKISTGNRTTLEPVMSVSASGSGPYTGFGPKISFSSNIYYGAATGNPAGIIETAYIGAVMGTTYATNSDLVFATRDGATSVTEKMRILGNGNVGIGTNSPERILHLDADQGRPIIQLDKGGDKIISMGTGSSATGADDTIFQMFNEGIELVRIFTEGSSYFNGGNVGIGTTSPDSKLDVTGGDITVNVSATGLMNYKYNNSVVGSITTNGVATAFNTSSDYRLKEDLQDFAGLDMVSKIPVYDFKWKTDESRSYGVMAHELQEVLPDAVSGEKDAEEMQGVDYSKIVPLLVKSIQELKAEIELLKSK